MRMGVYGWTTRCRQALQRSRVECAGDVPARRVLYIGIAEDRGRGTAGGAYKDGME